MLKVFFAKDLHYASYIVFVFVSDTWTRLQPGGFDPAFSLRIKAIWHTVFDPDALVLIVPVMARPHTIFDMTNSL